ncbi:zinc finger protein 184-like isoform X3 [Lytechinus variegatus]|uniref:zinc finger protein 184-like isoform X3 n=1 Tax=Lytechinus variegatus TaxID=7654 RepID=UPI001BB1893E|nr:zinc finger protein 184-like isoform X3 [Lytechinus variegatus]
MDQYSDVQVYFTAKEWAKISVYERTCIKNVKENYEMMINLGLQVNQPKFMQRVQVIKEEIKEESDGGEQEIKSRGLDVCPSELLQPQPSEKKPILKDLGNCDLLESTDFDKSIPLQTNPTSSGDQGNQSGDLNTQSCDQKTKLTEGAQGTDQAPKQSRPTSLEDNGQGTGQGGNRPGSGICRCKYCGSPYAIPLILARHLKYKHGHNGGILVPDSSHSHFLQMISGEIQNPLDKPKEPSHDETGSAKIGRKTKYVIYRRKSSEKQNKNSYFSRQCEKVINHQVGDAAAGERIHTGGHHYVCYYCDKAFYEASALKAHAQIHFEVYVCDYCDKTFNFASDLKAHERIHTGEKPYVCDYCGKAFILPGLLRAHKLHHTSDKAFVCDYCNKAFYNTSSLKLHKRIHTGESPYVCDQCGKAFNWKCNLERHIRIHTGEKPYVCDRCGWAFNEETSFRRHKQGHANEKRFVCVHCGKAFNQMLNLSIHERIHTGERNYLCDQCGKTFYRASHLKEHKRIHDSDKPYVCIHCGKAFNYASGLKLHKRIHTGENPYECDFCDKAFRKSSTLKCHITSKHK